MVNFWADIKLDEYINLKGRVESRIKMVDITSSGDSNLIDPEDEQELFYREQQLKTIK